MSRSKYFSFLIIFFILTSCSDNEDRSCFNGKIQFIRDVSVIESIPSEKISLDGITFGMPAVYDSLVFFYNWKQNTSFYNVFNLDTKKFLGEYCEKGGGPNESYGVPEICQFYKDGENLKTMLFAPNNDKLIEWNISKSVVSGKTFNDTIIPYNWKTEHIAAIYSKVYRLHEDELLVKVPSVFLSRDDTATLPYYQKRTVYSNKVIQNYRIYNYAIKGENSDRMFFSEDYLKPDGTKIVQGMRYFSQLNVIDLNTENVIGYRLKDTPGFSNLKADNTSGSKSIKTYYTQIQASDQYVYALYFGEEGIPEAHILHIFDWNGNLLKKIDLMHIVHRMCLDPIRNILYAVNMNTEDFYSFKLNEVE